MNIGIIGHGFVGKAVEYGFTHAEHNIHVYDKFKEGSTPLDEVLEKSEVIFLCLPTPFFEDRLEIDLSIYDEALSEICPKVSNTGKILVIKSTVSPGTTKSYSEKYPDVHFCFNPEFLTEANYLLDFVNTERVIVGANNDWVSQAVIMLYRSMPCFQETKIVQMCPTAAEIVKYQCNVLLATRVAVSNVFYDICQAQGVSYGDVQQGVELDSRIGSSHISVTSERGFGGKCFPKDLGAIIGRAKEISVDCKILEEVFEYNDRIRKVKDWHEIAGATVDGRDYSKETKDPQALFFRAKKIDGMDDTSNSGNCGGDYFKNMEKK